LISLAAIVGTLVATEYYTSRYLRASTPYRYAMEIIVRDERVQAALGVPITAGYTVASRRNMALFLLKWRVRGPLGSADVTLLSETSLKAAKVVLLQIAVPDGSEVTLVDNRHC